MAPLVSIVAGFVLGLAVGRWWTLLASVAAGVAIGITASVEVPGRYLGLGYGALSEAAIASGVAIRRRLARPDS